MPRIWLRKTGNLLTPNVKKSSPILNNVKRLKLLIAHTFTRLMLTWHSQVLDNIFFSSYYLKDQSILLQLKTKIILHSCCLRMKFSGRSSCIVIFLWIALAWLVTNEIRSKSSNIHRFMHKTSICLGKIKKAIYYYDKTRLLLMTVHKFRCTGFYFSFFTTPKSRVYRKKSLGV